MTAWSRITDAATPGATTGLGAWLVPVVATWSAGSTRDSEDGAAGAQAIITRVNAPQAG